MSCGFGAAVLLFLIIKHNVDTTHTEKPVSPELESEVSLLEEEIREGRLGLAALRNSLAELEQQIVIAQGLARRVTDNIDETAGDIESIATNSEAGDVDQLKLAIKELEAEKLQLEADTTDTGDAVRSFAGEGNREYLTGLRLDGSRILILLDTSASMLDETIVNVIRRRNMSDEYKRNAEKWQQALKTVDWITAKLPVTSKYQIYTFNTQAAPVLANTRGRWLDVSDSTQLDAAVDDLKMVIPEGGSSLIRAFEEVTRMQPLPDNIFLITDGLPTQGTRAPRSTTISGRDRLELFEEALQRMPEGIPINVILSPMEGDPMAASAFWQLAQLTEGSFMSPTRDWP